MSIFGVYGAPNAANLVYYGLHTLQHRGQEAAGIAAFDENGKGRRHRGLGLLGEVFNQSVLDSLPGSIAMGGVKYAKNWGIYVMIGRYADRDGNTPCMPDGFIPDIEVYDNPLDGYQLGDPNETMLKTVLTLAGYEYPAEPASVKKKPATIKGPASPKRETFGVFLRQ